MEDQKKSIIAENLAVLATPEGMQKYLFGMKKNGQPRAVYDIVKDFTKGDSKKKKKKNKKEAKGSYSFYIDTKPKKKKKKNKNKHWHI